MKDLDELMHYVELSVEHASDKSDAIIARGNLTSDSQIRFSQNDIDIAKRWESMELQLFVVIDGAKTGASQRSVKSDAEVREMVDDVVSFTKRSPDSMLFAGIEDKVKDLKKSGGNYDDRFGDFVENAPGIINSAIDEAVGEGAKRVAGALRFAEEHTIMKSSLGPKGESKETYYDLNIRAFQDELDYSGQGLSCGTIPSEAEADMLAAGKQAGSLSKKAIGAVQGEPGKYDLILSPTVAANIIANIPKSADPFSVLIGTSPLGDKLGEKLAPETVTVTDDPHLAGGLGSRAFDFEGTPTQKTTIVDEGVFKGYIHNTTTAKMYETETTGSSSLLDVGRGMRMLLPSYSNTVFENGDHKFDEMIETNKPTIYVTCNWYTRWQNYQTGEFSTIPRDALFLIEKGEMKPIKNVRISDNTLRMFSAISAIGNDRKQIYWWEVRVPTYISTMKVSDCRISAATK